MSLHKLKIAILEADVPMPNTAARQGSYGGVFTALLDSAMSSLGEPPAQLSLTKHAISAEAPLPAPTLVAELDGVLITGSRASAFDDTPWIVELVGFVRRLLHEGRVKVIGVCFGHQIVARALGAKVARSAHGWETSVMNVVMTRVGREIFGRDVLSINQMHRDVVTALPRGAANLGTSARCAIQGLFDEVEGRYLSIQGHPEFTPEIVAEILPVRRDAGIFSTDEWEDSMARLNTVHHGTEVGVQFLLFWMGGLERLVKGRQWTNGTIGVNGDNGVEVKTQTAAAATAGEGCLHRSLLL